VKVAAWSRLTRGQDIPWIFRNYGILAALRLLWRNLPYHLWLHFSPAGRKELQFDEIHGIETEGMLSRWEMGEVGANREFAVQYLPTRPKKSYAMLDSLRLDFHKFTFVDIGSGKGRVLLLAQQYGFRKIIGVEFVSSLCETARQNLQICHCTAEVVCMDASKFEIPSSAIVLYMCNPFTGKPMEQLIRNIEQSLAAYARPLYVIYWKPLCHELLSASPALIQIAHEPEEFSIFKSRYTV